MPSARFRHGFANDVFISYTHEDDNEDAGIRWVARFEAELRNRLAKVSGRSIQIWRDTRLSGADRFSPEIEAQLRDSAVLVTIVTPSYFRSQWCTSERGTFIGHARATRGLDVGTRSRLVKMAKTRVPLSQYPPELLELLEFRFYVEEPNGTAREFHLSPDDVVQKRFFTVVDDAAQAIEPILSGLEGGAASASLGSVYLGETSSDIEGERDQLRRSLTQRGYTVLPQAPLRLRTGPEVRRIAQHDLAECRLAVFPVGAYYGPVPEQADDQSITELQLEMALGDARNGALARMVWVPSMVAAAENRQKDLLARIRSELPGKGFEIIESPLAEIETHIKDRLEPPPGAAPVESAADEGKEIYVLCLPDDRDAARPLREHLHREGFEIRLPGAGGDNAAALHARRLESADAFLVYWGAADESWVEPVLTELKKAKGLRKGKPIVFKALFLADPATDEKRDFLTHQATLLRGLAPVPVGQALQPMIDALRREHRGHTP